MYHKITGITLPSFVWYLIELPKDLFFMPLYVIRKRKMFDRISDCFFRYWEIKRTVNKVRLEFFYFIEKKELRKKRNLLYVWYCADRKVVGTLEIKMRLHFVKTKEKIEDIKESCENGTSLRSSEFIKKDGNISFCLFDTFIPINKGFCNDESLSIGTSFNGLKIWNYRIYAHSLIIGATGSGKTNLLLYLIDNCLSNRIPMWVVDAKKVDLEPISNCFDKYVPFDTKDDILRVLDLLEECCELVRERNQKLLELKSNSYFKVGMKPIFIFIEEHASIIEMMNKAETETALKRIGYLVRMARASGIFMNFIMQRPDTKFLTGETRANINCRIVLGSYDKESYKMAFDTADISGKECMLPGQAWCKIGNALSYISIPLCKNKEVYYETAKHG